MHLVRDVAGMASCVRGTPLPRWGPMGHVPRDTTPGIHHVVVGATSDEAYFLTDSDRLVWIRRLTRMLGRFGWTCVGLCQLTTHVHAIVDVPDGSLPRGMHYLNAFYGQYFNETNERKGALVRSRYWSKRMVDDEQLVTTFRYVARNPVTAGLCLRAEDWPWSAFATSCGATRAFPFVDASVVLVTLGATAGTAAQTLRALVRD
jgi:putative transposase